MFKKINFDSITPKEAVRAQKELREKINLASLGKIPHLIAGADVSLEWRGDTAFAGIVVLSYPDLEVVETSTVKRELHFPYIPGLLSFREIPALLEAWEQLKTKPELVVVDGHGIAHPRRTGIATHFGLATDIPTIGVAKNKLYGTYAEPGAEAGSFLYLYDEKTNEYIGGVLRTKVNVKPVFVSPGNKISLDESLELILSVTRKHRLPEPTRLAHNLVNDFRKESKKIT